MDKQVLLSRISINPDVCFGKPCIRGTRIWVSLLLDLLATGSAWEEILEDYPHLTEDDIRACLLYGAETARGRRDLQEATRTLLEALGRRDIDRKLWIVSKGRIREYWSDDREP